MLSILNIRTVARFEIKTLLRSWFFRIFSLLTLIILSFFDLMVITDVGPTPPWMFRAIPASIPYFNLLIFNLVQAVIIVFLASEFLKRDKKLDTTDVIYIRSMSNGDYVIGKTIGILTVFFLLNIAVMVLSLIFNIVQTDTPIIWEAYLYYPLIISLPTLLFITGLSFFAMVILRNQAITFIVLLGYIALTLFFLTNKYNFIFDYMAFKLPLMYSDFVGFGNLKEILIQRSIYLFSGIGFIFLTILLIKRLPQSSIMTKVSYVLTIGFLLISGYSAFLYLSGHHTIESMKSSMVEVNTKLRNESILQIDNYSIDIAHEGDQIRVVAALRYENNHTESLDRLIFSLNPSLEVSELSLDGKSVDFSRNFHLIQVSTGITIKSGAEGEIVIKYYGSINDKFSYLDVEKEKIYGNNNLAFMNIDKRYGFVNEDFVLLTPEVLWYPISGVTYSPENPTFHNKQFSTYSINVKTKVGLTAISQGNVSESSDGTFTFSESIPLPQVSLTIGDYEKKSLMVDSLELSLYHLEGHDFYSPYITELDDTLSSIFGEIKEDYERDLNLDYYYKKFSVVEVPIQFYSYSRRWASYQEVVQPQLVFLPEKCASLTQADFKGSYKREKRRIDQSNQAISDKELQARILNRFISGTFTNGFSGPRMVNFNSGNQADFARAFTASSIYTAFPNYYSFIYYVKSGEWSVLNQAFESYLTGENEDMMSLMRRRISGLSGDENANQALMEKSFAEILKSEADRELMDEVIKAKGNYLFAFIQNQIGIEAFDNFLSKILRAHKFKGLEIAIFNKALQEHFNFDLEPHLENWLTSEKIPGYLLSSINAYEIRDGENTRYQVKFTITNEEAIDGLATVSFRTNSGGGFGGFGGGGGAPSLDLERIIHLEPHQKKEISIVLDSEPRLMAINTLISQNVPSAISHFFSNIDQNEKMKPFNGEQILEISKAKDSDFEIIVDNEDDGFELIQSENESVLKKWLKIENTTDEKKYVGIRFNRPPNTWKATAQPEFYGKYVLSAHITAKGSGDRQAIWNANIKQTGMHEIYYFVGRLPTRGRGRQGGGPGGRRGGGQRDNNQDQQNEGNYLLTVFHDDGEEQVNLDVAKAEEGWNLLGNYYLSQGATKVILSNETEGNLVIADAVKWVKVE